MIFIRVNGIHKYVMTSLPISQQVTAAKKLQHDTCNVLLFSCLMPNVNVNIEMHDSESTDDTKQLSSLS